MRMHNSVVDADDLTVWENQFGGSSQSALATVPEPATGVLLLGVVALGMIPRLGRSLNERQLNR